jgi:uncharacterized protein YbjT (DUF2867 family)
VVTVPAATSLQPIDAAEVAQRLAGLAAGPPAGRVPDLGGPQIRPATSLLRAYLQAAGRRTWEEFLAGQLTTRRRSGAEGSTVGGRT